MLFHCYVGLNTMDYDHYSHLITVFKFMIINHLEYFFHPIEEGLHPFVSR
ncbi:hypothetical protein SAMN04488514_1235 [Kriegella aquimaris]|uniref:Uncharacterized protein n=1 Tax=Kriegella aquimaris TaxID=192904 RepID=A0A1G9YHR2_9FLAO|nr:hypothetical protein SAMN04488514_1235 [Kriegella aquimaris]